MQETRQHILDIVRERGEATVDDIVNELQKRRGKITAVTVRHHLSRLQEENLITVPLPRHRDSPGRPQHIYSLTERARDFFPSNYQKITATLLQQIRQHLPPQGVNVILEGVAKQMAQEAGIPDAPLRERLRVAVDYLNQSGYQAECEHVAEGYILRTMNCPYHQVAQTDHSMCDVDMRLVASMLGVIPRLLSRVAEGDNSCAYLIPDTNGE